MLSMQDINNELKQSFESQLKEVSSKSLPDDLAKGYKAWVQSLIKTTSQQVQTEQQQNAQGEQQEQSAEGGAA